ncbi:reverse transcriptase domain-containing protein [Clostridium sp.]|uniref:reverse transcriptase domain-containing protein n=1 Tax=Clostridium sp. TaxID=1506 RepID=UPI001B4176FE|nr:reverse transcriptase domain-containing protein [Clostridium sp.]MBP3914454.1 hypothetical protein [Clostridium sp.]
MSEYYDEIVINNRLVDIPKFTTSVYENFWKNKLEKEIYTYKLNKNEIIDKITDYLLDKNINYIVRTDIKSFFNSIDIETLKRILDNELKKSSLSTAEYMKLKQFINDVCLSKGRLLTGSSLSPILSCIYTKDLFKDITHAGIKYINYVDDIIIFCEDLDSAENNLNYLKNKLLNLGLHINENKTNIGSKYDYNSFLEFKFKVNEKYNCVTWDIRKSTQKRLESTYKKYSNIIKINYINGNTAIVDNYVEKTNQLTNWILKSYSFLTRFNQAFKFSGRVIEDLNDTFNIDSDRAENYQLINTKSTNKFHLVNLKK